MKDIAFPGTHPVGSIVESTHPIEKMGCKGVVTGHCKNDRGWDVCIVEFESGTPEPYKNKFTSGWLRRVG